MRPFLASILGALSTATDPRPRMTFRRTATLLLAAALSAGAAGAGYGAEKAKPAVAEKKSSETQAGTPDAGVKNPKIPDGTALSILIRRTLLTLNDANLSGNYTVLRDLAAPGFQDTNNAARLSEIFVKLRSRAVDLAPILYIDPKLVRDPAIDENGMLRVSGFIPSQPEQVNFDMMFQDVGGRWRLFGIAVNTTPVAAALPAAAPAGAAQKKQ